MGSPITALARMSSVGLCLGRGPVNAARYLPVLVDAGLLGPYDPHELWRIGRVLRRWGMGPAALFALGAAVRPGAIGVVDHGGSWTFGDLDHDSTAMAAGLRDSGVGQGDKVAVLCRNHRGFLLTLAALGKVGADAVFLNTGFAVPQARDVLSSEGVSAVIADEDLGALNQSQILTGPLRSSSDAAPSLFLWSGPGPRRQQLPAQSIELEDLVEEYRHAEVVVPRPRRISRQVILTSGTTGPPKGANRDVGPDPTPLLGFLSSIPLRTAETTVIAAPMFHAWGLFNSVVALLLGSEVVTATRFDPENVLALIERHAADVLVAVPAMLQRILDLGDGVLEGYDTSSLRVVAVSGSALPGNLATRFLDRFGEVLYNLYGSTETGWVSVAGPADLRADPSSAGRVVLGTEVRVLSDDGTVAEVGEVGRIMVKSGLSFDGYTGGGGKAVVDGYMSTGDLGHLEPGGTLFVDGREDDMIVSGGENVFPGEVEALLASHPSVLEAAVLGVPDERFGQRLNAYAVPAPGRRPDETELRSFVRSRLAGYKVPRRVFFLETLPRNTTGKVQKSLLNGAEGA